MDQPELKQRLDAVFRKQRDNRWKVARTTAKERVAKLKALRDAMLRHTDDLTAALKADFRKHPFETEFTEVLPAVLELNHTISNLSKWMKPQKVKTPRHLLGTSSEIRFESKGQVLILAPWNYPFALVINPLICAIAAGNVVMIKPSEKTPQTARMVATIVAEVFDESEVAVFEGGVEVSTGLLDLPFDHIFFTGSTRVGRVVMEAAAKHLASVTLELGGKSPTLVDKSADLEAAAERICWGKLVNAGQTCIAPDYVYVHSSVAQRFVELLKGAVAKSYGATEAERQASDSLARIIDAGAFSRLKELVDKSVAAGARVEMGATFDAEQRYIAPTLLTDVKPEHAVMSDEIFGPILPILTYDTRDEVYRHVQSRGKPLALYLFAKNKAVIEEVLANTTAGGTVINNTLIHFGSSELPFGGVGESGLGAYHGHIGFKTFSHERAVLRQAGPNLVKLFFPPYTEKQRGRQRLLQKL